jgi:CTP synthase (UTP-ammonia lyase)
LSFVNYSIDTCFRADTLCKDVTIALVGKYTKLEESYASVTKALQHATLAAGLRLRIKVRSEKILYDDNIFWVVMLRSVERNM